MSQVQDNKIQLLKNSLLEFYGKKKNMEIITNIVAKKTKYSLRLYEWLCSNYSSRHPVIYNVTKTKEFNMYSSYKEYLDSYQKRQFDPFKRNHDGYDKFTVNYPDGRFVTTICQLNFFRWVISNKINKYLEDNFETIKADMDRYKTPKGTKTKTKKKQDVSIRNSNTTLKF
jgi:hypothetical protein